MSEEARAAILLVEGLPSTKEALGSIPPCLFIVSHCHGKALTPTLLFCPCFYISRFARLAATAFISQGVPVHLFSDITPTPFVVSNHFPSNYLSEGCSM